MSKVYCTGITCKYNANGMCTRENINLDDFEYFLSADDKKKDIIFHTANFMIKDLKD